MKEYVTKSRVELIERLQQEQKKHPVYMAGEYCYVDYFNGEFIFDIEKGKKIWSPAIISGTINRPMIVGTKIGEWMYKHVFPLYNNQDADLSYEFFYYDDEKEEEILIAEYYYSYQEDIDNCIIYYD